MIQVDNMIIMSNGAHPVERWQAWTQSNQSYMQDQGCISLEGHPMEEGQGELQVMQNQNESWVNQIDSLLKVVLPKKRPGPSGKLASSNI